MVYRWRCRHCEFTTWAADGAAVADAVRDHLLDHHASNVRRDGIRTEWRCPYCDAHSESYGDDVDPVDGFSDHLFGHVEGLIETGVHVADDVGGTGSVLVTAPLDGTAADNARAHFLAPGDAVIVVTANPAARLRLIDRKLGSWPARATFLTTAEDPLDGVSDLDPSQLPVEFVRLDGGSGLSGVGETLARCLGDHEEMTGTLSVEFDILPELVDKFDLRTVFKFLHLLSSRLERADALSHYYVDPRRQRTASINVLEGAFDMSIRAAGETFTSDAVPSE
jgi:rubredoxin